MKITEATIYIVALPTRRHHTWASKMTAPIGRHALVRLGTDQGVEGWGEAPAGITWGGSAMRYYGESPETVRVVAADYLLPAVAGCDPREMAVIHSRMDRAVKGHPYAKAMIDVACYDVAGRAMGVAVSTLLGGSFRRGVELAHSLGIMPIDRCLAEARQAVAEGALTIKCKTGLDPDRDVELVRRLRESVGPQIRIRVDGNEGYSHVAEAVAVTRAQEEYDIMLCEQPVAGAEELAAVARRVDTPVMADESAWTVEDIWGTGRIGGCRILLVLCHQARWSVPGASAGGDGPSLGHDVRHRRVDRNRNWQCRQPGAGRRHRKRHSSQRVPGFGSRRRGPARDCRYLLPR